MQKVIRATSRAKTQAQRKIIAEKSKNRKVDRRLLNNERQQYRKEITTSILNAKNVRKEDWMLGPLAPRRDVGDQKDTYGTVSTRLITIPNKPKGQWKDWYIQKDDRVVIVGAHHKERGKIGKVKEVDREAEFCLIEGLNLFDVKVPQFLLEAEPNQKPLQTIEAPIPLSDVRLVYPLPHPTTGVRRDVIIKELMSFTKNGDRFVAGMHPRVRIPYVKQPKMEEDEHDIDMLRIEVEDRTWTPTLFTAPMPESVINELRNKYGVFRVRHDDSFIAAKENSEREQEKLVKKRELRMLTPLEEFHQLERAKRKALGRESLDEEMLARIGKVMARNKAISMNEETSH